MHITPGMETISPHHCALQDGGVAPVGGTAVEAVALRARLGGEEERFAFVRAVSRIYEMQSEPYLRSRMRR